ncbi:MAG: pyridoxamine 5'-phosphate oxidase family protein [Selenomonas montiformis]|nr:pyridoxamine 5'-phosphate oxidase family protein [Selenomonas montiformis]
MRRKDREVTDLDRIFEIVARCSVAHVGMVDHGGPYVVALNFGYERQGNSLVLYFHSAFAGRKMDILQDNPSVYVQMHCADEFISGSYEKPCALSWRYDSVMGAGTVEFLKTPEEKAHALNCMIQHLSKKEDAFSFPGEMLKHTCVYRVCIDAPTGKHHE